MARPNHSPEHGKCLHPFLNQRIESIESLVSQLTVPLERMTSRKPLLLR